MLLRSDAVDMKKILILFLLFAAVLPVLAQEKKGMVHLEVTDSKGVKKELDAKCFVLTIIKANSNFAVALFDKAFIADAQEIKVSLSQQQSAEPALINLPINGQNVVQSEKLAGIPYLVIKQNTAGLGIVKPTFYPDSLLLQTMKGVTEKDLEDFNLAMEKWAGY